MRSKLALEGIDTVGVSVMLYIYCLEQSRSVRVRVPQDVFVQLNDNSLRSRDCGTPRPRSQPQTDQRVNTSFNHRDWCAMSTGHVSSGPPASSSSTLPRVTPLIPERYLDIPSQRLYALSFGLLIQVSVPFVYLRADTSTHSLSNSSLFRP